MVHKSNLIHYIRSGLGIYGRVGGFEPNCFRFLVLRTYHARRLYIDPQTAFSGRSRVDWNVGCLPLANYGLALAVQRSGRVSSGLLTRTLAKNKPNPDAVVKFCPQNK